MAQSEMVASLPICIILKRFFKMQVIFVSLKKLPNSDPIFAFDFSLSLWISFIDLGFSQSFLSVSRWLDAFSGMTNVSNRKTDGSNNAGLSLSASSRAFVCRITALLQVSMSFFTLFFILDIISTILLRWSKSSIYHQVIISVQITETCLIICISKAARRLMVPSISGVIRSWIWNITII